MANDAYMIGASLLKTGTLVSFRIVEEEVLTAHDEAEFGMRLLLKFVPEEGEDDQDEDDVAEDTAEWGAFGFMFVLGVLSFDEAKPRNLSTADYHEKDGFNVADFIERLRFVRGELHFDADYIRGRRIQRYAGSSGCKERSFYNWSGVREADRVSPVVASAPLCASPCHYLILSFGRGACPRLRCVSLSNATKSARSRRSAKKTAHPYPLFRSVNKDLTCCNRGGKSTLTVSQTYIPSHIEIVVNDLVANTAHLAPRQHGMFGHEFRRDLLNPICSLTDHGDGANNGVLGLLVLL